MSLDDTNVDWNSLSDTEVELRAIEATAPIPAAEVSRFGNFYSVQHPEWPPLPGNIDNVPCWPLDTNLFLLDDRAVNYAASLKSAIKAGKMTAMDYSGPPSPGDDGGGSTNSYSPNFQTPVDYGTNLWIANFAVTSTNTVGTLSNSLADILYEVQYKHDLATDTQWMSAGFVYGSELTNWTALVMTNVSRTNNAFFRIRSWQDDGSGLPIWWQLQYFGTNGVDPYGNPAGDGWNNLQKFQNGMNPNQFYTPAAPQGLTATYHSNSNTATISWQLAPGPVTGYTVYDSDGNTFNFSAGTSSFDDNLSADVPGGYYTGDPTIYTTYQVQAHYAGGDSTWSSLVSLDSPQNSVSATIINSQNNIGLVVSALPPDTVAIRLTKIDEMTTGFFGDNRFNTNGDVPVGSFTNGIYYIPVSWTPVIDSYGTGSYSWWIQTISANGNVGAATTAWNDPHYWGKNNKSGAVLYWPAPFFDGRAQLKQNLIFQLRAATLDFPFGFYQTSSGETTNPVTYVCAGFNQMNVSSAYQDWTFNQYKPVADNYLYRNFVFAASELNASGRTTTGVGGNYGAFPYTLTLSNTPAYQFRIPTNFSSTLPTLLSPTSAQWLCAYAFDSAKLYLPEIGVATNGSGTYFMAGNARNYWGLPFLSAKIGYGNGLAVTLAAGGNTTQGGYFYPETAQPQFQTAEYDFWIPEMDWLPGQSGFSLTNQSRLMITGTGQSRVSGAGGNGHFNVAAYAKLAVQNAYNGVYGYLQQYFDKACRIDTNGIVTTNTTGFLSPYGDFFATEPGPAALVTMPDVDTGARGTCTVYCVSLQLDANHDGAMDLSFSGPDATSPASPYIFWCNNNFDRWATTKTPLYTETEQDDILTNGVADCNYTDFFGNRIVPTTRDLEDYARLWVCGVTSNLLAALPAGSTITLSWGDVGSPNPGNPTIDLFTAADADGGIGYLTNSATAANQINSAYSPYIGRLAPGGSLQLNANIFGNIWRGNYFIWCGVANGSGQLSLTIQDASGNILGQASAWIQIEDIKNMYERWTVGDDPKVTPLTTAKIAATDLPDPTQPPFQYTPPADTNTSYILFVHGWNLKTWEKDRFAETAFKRLYWQGYQGRFGSFRWPTDVGFTTFDSSEFTAWNSAVGLTNFLAYLDAQYHPGNVYLMAHSQGNVVAGEAMRLAGNHLLVNTYVAMQAAVPAHCYDPNTSNRYAQAIPDRYAHYWTDSATNYFYNIQGAGTYVNFFNTNDWALVTAWEPDQDTKPDVSKNCSYVFLTGQFYQGSTPLNFPQDTYKIFAYCDPAACQALGAQANVAGVFKTLTYHQVELPTVWPPDPLNNNYKAHIWHSAEFRSDNAQRWQFWNQVLVQFGLKENQ